ncbi:MAG: DNA polymerase I [Gammaproteobacteria bacterium]|nr:DNA polymerase I [Gammaproteobacteria bacterium]
MSVKEKLRNLILIDGSAYLYRAFYALPPLQNNQGQETGAIHGFIKAINKITQDYKPTNIAVVFDPKGKNFRHDIYPEYKANRSKMPEELSSQIPILYTALDLIGLRPIIKDGVEADDIIGTLARKFSKENIKIEIFSGDKDFAQLVNKNINIINPVNFERLDEKGIERKYEVNPKYFIDYLSLMGDKSDNIPGVPGIGSKTAIKMINEYKNIDNIIKESKMIKGKVGSSIQNNVEKLLLSKSLATIKCDVDLPYVIDDLVKKDTKTEELLSLYKELDFKSLIKDLSSTNINDPVDKTPDKDKETKYKVISNEEELSSVISEIKNKKFFSVDTETTSLDYTIAEIVGISISTEARKGYYIPIKHTSNLGLNQISLNYILEKLKPILESENIKKVGHNLKYDMNVLSNYNINLSGIEHDTMLLSYVYDSTGIRHGLDNVARKYLEYETIHYEDLTGKGVHQIPFSEVSIDKAAEYSCEDVDISLRLYNFFWKKISNNEDLKKIYMDIEVPLIKVLSKMEKSGVLVDKKGLLEYSKELHKELDKIEKSCYKISLHDFNINSPKQLQEVLYEEQGLPVLKKTPSGKPSTDEETLQELSIQYELPRLILEYRSLSKLKSTYTDKLPVQISERTGRVHTSYQQAVTSTGRLSSTSPNLQNIPIKTQQGKRIRESFITKKSYKILSADYSQIELRIMAHLSKDKNLCNAFLNMEDVHKATASEVFGIEASKVTNEQRRAAKTINFGLIYGMSAFGLSKQLSISMNEAKSYIETYFLRYPGVKNYMEESKEFARNNGYVQTIYGRRLYLPDIKSSQAQRRNYAERTAINAPVQGSAADIIKIVMIEIDKWIEKERADVQMIMQVHDELVFEVKKEILEKDIKSIIEIMENSVKLSLPLKVNYGLGSTWEAAH